MSRAYRLIFFLLTFSVIGVLALQSYWIYQSYKDRSQQLDSKVYAALGEIGRKINERRKIGSLKEQVFTVRTQLPRPPAIRTKANVSKPGNKVKRVVIVERNLKDFHKKREMYEYRTDHNIDSIIKTSGNALIAADKALKEAERTMATALTELDTSVLYRSVIPAEAVLEEDHEIEVLLNKMLHEISATSIDEAHPDSLKKLMLPVLYNYGFFDAFEFSLKELNKKKEKIIVQSKGFNAADFSYRHDLSAETAFNYGQFVFLQLPARFSLVLNEMKTSLILSFIFSFLILGSFFYTLRLILQQKKLVDIKNDFVNNMTHELKTPIATISLAVDALNNPLVRNNDNKFDDYTRILKEENKRLNHHVERVLQLSLLEKGELQLDLQPLDLVLCVQDCVKEMQLLIDEKKADVSILADPQPLVIKADKEHLKAVLRNLIDNALKYSGGHPTIEISCRQFREEIMFKIKDKGIGIAAGQQEKVFEKFYRVHGGDLHEVKGFGLGLSYVKTIVEAHGGSIKVNSELNRGSEFIIIFKKYDQDIAG